ncbi:MAG: NAD(P)/FAD-dependent oxidoreductase [Ilumatobacteraceae bacterium]
METPSYLYSFAFARGDWSHHFSLRDELHAYLERVGEEFGITSQVQFGTEVTEARFDPNAQGWVVEAIGSDGTREVHRANVVISAVGAFNKPRIPDVKGAGSFAGPEVHTAQWPQGGLDLRGKRVAVIGNGASAMQLVPAIAPDVAEVTVFQRTPQWAAPFDKFHLPVPSELRFLLAAMPVYHDWYRMRLSWAYNDEIHPSLQKDPNWTDPDRSINASNDRHREYFTKHIVAELGDRQDLLPKVLPSYPPYGKRMLMDNGWFRTLTLDNVHLVTDSVTEIVSGGVRTANGEYDADVLVWATGFDVVRFLAPMKIVGRSGHTLAEQWGDDDARAYLGTVIPDMPNFFCLYGPNAQFGHGGSLITIMDRQVHYVMSVLRQMFEAGTGVVEVDREVHDNYNAKVDAAHEKMVWTHRGMDTYYRNSRGRVVAINPFKVVDFWAMTDRADLGEFLTEPAISHA